MPYNLLFGYSEQLLTAIADDTYQQPVLDITYNPNMGHKLLDEKAAECLANALATNTHIKEVNLSSHRIGYKGIAALAKIKTLTSLNVSGNNIGETDVVALAEVKMSLTTLNLSSNALYSRGVIAALETALKNNPCIKELVLSNNNIDDAGAIALAEANIPLTTLNLTGNNIGPSGAEALARIATLRILNLSRNINIGIEGINAFAQNTTLTDLHLRDCCLDAEAAKALAMNKTLTLLDLHFNCITDQGAMELAKNTTLNKLHLSENRIGDAGAVKFAQNKTLIFLSIERGNKISGEVLKKINSRIQYNQITRENWLTLAPLVVFFRANGNHAFHDSILPLLPCIAKFSDEKYPSYKAKAYINLPAFLNTCFFKQMAAQANPQLSQLEDKSEKLPTTANNLLKLAPVVETENAKKQTVEAKAVMIDNKQNDMPPFLSAQAQTTDNPSPAAKVVIALK